MRSTAILCDKVGSACRNSVKGGTKNGLMSPAFHRLWSPSRCFIVYSLGCLSPIVARTGTCLRARMELFLRWSVVRQLTNVFVETVVGNLIGNMREIYIQPIECMHNKNQWRNYELGAPGLTWFCTILHFQEVLEFWWLILLLMFVYWSNLEELCN